MLGFAKNIISLFGSLRNCTSAIISMVQKLAVFDFDHTVVDDNSDIVVRKLLKNNQIPDSTKVLYRNSGWTVYMQEIFKLLFKYNIKKEQITKAIVAIPAVESIIHLIISLNKLNFDVIIISDSNTVFIDDWLEAMKLKQFINHVFTNPAKYNDNGMLEINMYHVQYECSLSTVNLCKGKIMEDFIKSQSELGIIYDQIVYVGDGKNDFCPILKLNENDIACVREGYACIDLVKNALEKKSNYTIKAKVCIWKNGMDILNFIQK